MHAFTRKAVIAAGILVVLLIVGRTLRKPPAQPSQAANALNPYGQMASPAPVFNPAAFNAMGMNQVAMYKLISQYGMPMGIASYLTQAKAQVLSQTNTSAHFVLTFANNLTSDETITITPNQQYTPTSAELAQAGQRHVYNVKLSVQNESESKARIRLQYFVPYTAVPANLQQRIQSQSAFVDWVGLVPSAWAQEGGGSSLGMNVASDTTVEVTKEILKQTAEHGKLSKEFPTPLSRLVDVLNAFKKEEDHVAWLDELDELQDCAENPSNPLTQKAFNQDPAYRDQVVHGVTQARADVTAITGMRFVNLATSVATDLVEGPLGAITSPISSFNDESLKELAENRVKDANKGITPCHNKPIPAGQFRPMKGTIEYKYKRSSKDCVKEGCSFSEETRLVTGTFVLTPEAHGWGMGGEGMATLSQKIDGGTKNQMCRTEEHSTLSGNLKITVEEAGGTLYNGMIRLLVGSNDNLEADETHTSTCGVGGTEHRHWTNAAFGFNCQVENLDMVNGSSSSAFIPADQGYGTCTIEVSPQ